MGQTGTATAADGTAIAFEVDGEGPPLVLVHGITEDRRTWAPVLGRLAERYRCVRLDLRGHGVSAMADDWSVLALGGDVSAVVAELGLEAPAIVGHSLGAVAATVHAATGGPARAVVDVDQSLRFADFGAALRPLAPMLEGDGVRDALRLVFDALGAEHLPPGARAYTDECIASIDPAVVRGIWGPVLASSDEELEALADPLLAGVTVPYLALHGSDPGPGYEAWLTERIPTATLEVWDGLGHHPHAVDPDRFVDRVSTFLDGPTTPGD